MPIVENNTGNKQSSFLAIVDNPNHGARGRISVQTVRPSPCSLVCNHRRGEMRSDSIESLSSWNTGTLNPLSHAEDCTHLFWQLETLLDIFPAVLFCVVSFCWEVHGCTYGWHVDGRSSRTHSRQSTIFCHTFAPSLYYFLKALESTLSFKCNFTILVTDNISALLSG